MARARRGRRCPSRSASSCSIAAASGLAAAHRRHAARHARPTRQPGASWSTLLQPGLAKLDATVDELLRAGGARRGERRCAARLIALGAPRRHRRPASSACSSWTARSASPRSAASSASTRSQLTRAYTRLGEALGLDWAQNAAHRFQARDQWERLLTAGLARDFEQLRLEFLDAAQERRSRRRWSSLGRASRAPRIDQFRRTVERARTGQHHHRADARPDRDPGAGAAGALGASAPVRTARRGSRCRGSAGRALRHALGVDPRDEALSGSPSAAAASRSASQKIGSRLIEVAWPAIIIERLTGPIFCSVIPARVGLDCSNRASSEKNRSQLRAKLCLGFCVIPAKAGIQRQHDANGAILLDSRFRGNDRQGPRTDAQAASRAKVDSPTACGRPPQYMCWPPLIDRVEPVMKPPSSPHRKATPRAISSAWPSRPTGILATIFSSTSARHRGDHVGVDIAGRDRVDGDAGARAFLRQRLGEAVDAGLGGGIIDLAVLAGLAVDRADVDDAAELARVHARRTPPWPC